MKFYYFLVIILYSNLDREISDGSIKDNYYEVYNGKYMRSPRRKVSINVVSDFGLNGDGKEDNTEKFKQVPKNRA